MENMAFLPLNSHTRMFAVLLMSKNVKLMTYLLRCFDNCIITWNANIYLNDTGKKEEISGLPLVRIFLTLDHRELNS